MNDRQALYLSMIAIIISVVGINMAYYKARGPEGPQGPEGPLGPRGPMGPSFTVPGEGLDVTILDAKVGDDLKPVLTLNMTDSEGVPVTPGDLTDIRFMIAAIEVDRETRLTRYSNYFTRTAEGVEYVYEGEAMQPVFGSWEQPDRDSGGVFEEVEPGVFRYTFGKALPVDYDPNATHVVGLYAYKNDRQDVSNAIYTFVPGGGEATVERRIVTTEACNVCHEPLALHGEVRQEVILCTLCHTPGNIDPETGNSVDLKGMVHRIHTGAELPSVVEGEPYYIVGFRQTVYDYSEVHWPQDVRNCTKCHTGPQGDNYKTAPSRAACDSCHDDINHETGEGHPGGVQTSDALCSGCHVPEGVDEAIVDSHEIEPWPFAYIVELSMTPPANGDYYVPGEAPPITIVIKDLASGETIDPNNITVDTWSRANLFVSGPRHETKPVLTYVALQGGYTFYAENELQVDAHTGDPAITRSEASITYQLVDVANLTSGTYTVFVEVRKEPTGPVEGLGGWGLLNFQVGTSEVDPYIATNCGDCHGDGRMHETFFAVEFNTDICKSCHDYERQVSASLGWTFEGGWNGFGAAPIIKKVHGVHYGSSLSHPEDLMPFGTSDEYKRITFPMDVQNCWKCHSESDYWNEEPSRLACLSCHDGDEVAVHARLMTFDPTSDDPWSGDELESCAICHGEDRDYNSSDVHVSRQIGTINISESQRE